MGAKLAEGRDSEIFQHGPGRVLRRARNGRSLVAEADVMRYVRDNGYPAPEVFDAGEGWLIMERLNGTDMLAGLRKTPRGVVQAAKVLADLHRTLGAIKAPQSFRVAPGPAGDRVVHLDLHPLNVMMTPGGPVVIDWSNAGRGDPAMDVATTWALMACADVPGGRVDRTFTAIGRGFLVRTFLSSLDRAAAAKALPAVVAWRDGDAHLSAAEHERMHRLATRESPTTS